MFCTYFPRECPVFPGTVLEPEAARAAAELAEDVRRLDTARARAEGHRRSLATRAAQLQREAAWADTQALRAEATLSRGTAGASTPSDPDHPPVGEISESPAPSPAEEGPLCDWSPSTEARDDEAADDYGGVPTGDAIVKTLDADALDQAEAEDFVAAIVNAAPEGPAPSQEQEAAAEALAAMVGATIRPQRRQALLSRRVVEVREGSLKYYQVLSAGERSDTIDRVLRARDEAAQAEAMYLGLDASTLEKARESLVSAGRAVLAPPAADGFRYLVYHAALAKRSKYLYFQAWSLTDDGYYWLHGWDGSIWRRIPLEGLGGAPAISRAAKPICKTHCDKTFGGEVWFNVLIQMGGCPAEFVDAYNVAIGRRLQAAIEKHLHTSRFAYPPAAHPQTVSGRVALIRDG